MQKEGLEKLLKRTDFDDWSQNSENSNDKTASEKNISVQIKEEAGIGTKPLTINPMIVFKTTFGYQIRKYKCKIMWFNSIFQVLNSK